jgi:hypothetical protein
MCFLVKRFEYTICYSECHIFSRYTFPETMLFWDQYVVSMQMLA